MALSYKELISYEEKDTFRNMIDDTRRCLENKRIRPGNIDASNFNEALACEVAMFSTDNGYTYHTHPNGDPRPSEQDIITTNRYKKRFMFIGLVPQRKVVVYEGPKFDRLIGQFTV